MNSKKKKTPTEWNEYQKAVAETLKVMNPKNKPLPAGNPDLFKGTYYATDTPPFGGTIGAQAKIDELKQRFTTGFNPEQESAYGKIPNKTFGAAAGEALTKYANPLTLPKAAFEKTLDIFGMGKTDTTSHGISATTGAAKSAAEIMAPAVKDALGKADGETAAKLAVRYAKTLKDAEKRQAEISKAQGNTIGVRPNLKDNVNANMQERYKSEVVNDPWLQPAEGLSGQVQDKERKMYELNNTLHGLYERYNQANLAYGGSEAPEGVSTEIAQIRAQIAEVTKQRDELANVKGERTPGASAEVTRPEEQGFLDKAIGQTYNILQDPRAGYFLGALGAATAPKGTNIGLLGEAGMGMAKNRAAADYAAAMLAGKEPPASTSLLTPSEQATATATAKSQGIAEAEKNYLSARTAAEQYAIATTNWKANNWTKTDMAFVDPETGVLYQEFGIPATGEMKMVPVSIPGTRQLDVGGVWYNVNEQTGKIDSKPLAQGPMGTVNYSAAEQHAVIKYIGKALENVPKDKVLEFYNSITDPISKTVNIALVYNMLEDADKAAMADDLRNSELLQKLKLPIYGAERTVIPKSKELMGGSANPETGEVETYTGSKK